ncbi:MAG TPA: hypothetical protein VJO53_00105 [Candidatus Acidoferrales bacterium]|nr:hypothetical protein [Candidatus Acidoferrales bacterium]
MRGKDYNTGLRGVLFEAQHHRRMGAALWLYGWLVLRQTHQHGPVGWVLGGAPISYREISDETGFNCRTLERWMRSLRREGYIETDPAPGGVIVRILKAKKFPQGGRRFAEGVRRIAEARAQSCVANRRNSLSREEFSGGIGSSSVGGVPEGKGRTDFRNIFQSPRFSPTAESETSHENSLGLSANQNHAAAVNSGGQAEPKINPQAKYFLDARLRSQLLRAERDEAVRRELAVGTGPEVRHS